MTDRQASVGYVHAIAHQLGPLYMREQDRVQIPVREVMVLDFYVDDATPQLADLADADVPAIVQRALAEAHGTYPVPTYMSVAACATAVRRAAGRTVVAAADHPPAAVGTPEKNKV